MPLDPRHATWLEQAGVAVGARVEWAHSEAVKSERLGQVRGQLAAMKDELRELNRYEAELKSLFGTKSIQSLKGTSKGWDPNAELDTGRDVKKMAKALPPDVLRRLEEAQDRILALEDALLHVVPATDHAAVRARLQAVADGLRRAEPAAKEAELLQRAREQVAREFHCPIEEVDEIRLSAGSPQGVPKEAWGDIKSRNDEAAKQTGLAEKDLERAEKALEEAKGKPASVRKKLDQKRQEEAQKVSDCRAAEDLLRDKMAAEHGVSRAMIDAIIGWKPSFSDLELRNELWKPLVREGVIPDNVVPDRVNETVQVFQGANDLYQERLNDEFYGQEDPDKVAKALGTAKSVVEQTAKLADVLVKAAGGPEIIGTVVSATSAIAQGTLTTVQAIRTKELESGLTGIGDILGTAVGLALGDSEQGKVLTGAITTSYKVAVKGAVSLEKVLAQDPPDWQGAVKAIGEAIVTSLSLCGDSPEQKKMFTQIGKVVESGFVGGVAIAEIARCMRQDPPDVQGCIKVLNTAAQHAFSRVSAGIAAQQDSTLGLGPGGAKSTKLKGAALEDERQRLEEGLGGVSLEAAFQGLGDLTKATAALQKAEAEQHQKQMDDELKAWRTQLVLGFGGDSADPEAIKLAAEQGNIDKMIAQIQRDRALLQMAEQIFSAGIKTAGQFFAPLRMADYAKDFVKQMVMAVKRAVELSEWIDLNDKALRACSVQGFAFANRVLNLKVQVSRRTLDAMMELGKLIGATAETAGQLSSGSGFGAALIPAGRAVEHGSQLAQQLIAIVYEKAQKAELARQWRKYKRCLEDPYDRTLMRDVIAGNPTLSKYAMAYAALEEDDVIAKQGMKTCGLSEEALKNPGTNAGKVVEFLETKFNDDPTLIKKLAKQDWQVDRGELTLASWMANKKAAVTELKLANAADTGAIEFGITRLANALRVLDTSQRTLAAAQKDYDSHLRMFAPRSDRLQATRGTFDDQREHLARLSAAHDQALQAAGDQAVADDYTVALAAYLRGLKDIIETGDLLLNDVQQQFLDGVAAFTASAGRLAAAANLAPFDAVGAAAAELAAGLRSFKPLRVEGGRREACPDFAGFCEAMATLAEIKAANVAKERKAFADALAAAKETREEVVAARDEVQGAPFQQVRTAVQQAKQKLQLATSNAQGVRARRGRK